MRRFVRSLCCSTLLMLSCALPNARVFAADKWVHASSAHFDMYAAESDSEVVAALQHLEAVRAFFVARTNSDDPGGQPVRVVVFHSQADFEKYRPAMYAGSNSFSFEGKPATIVSIGLKPEQYERIFLEYCQLVMDESAPKFPYWLRAGLAQFYSTLKPGDGTMKLGAPPTREYHVSGASQVDLTQLIGIDRAVYLASKGKGAADFGADNDHSNAALGKGAAATTALIATAGGMTQNYEGPVWTLTHMLMFSADYRGKVGEFMNAMGGGQETGAALNAVYGRALAQVGNDLGLYMKQSALPVASLKFAWTKPAAPAVKGMTKDEQDSLMTSLKRK